MTNDSEQEIIALNDELRYWKRQAEKAKRHAVYAIERASNVVKPAIAIVDPHPDGSATFFRIYVNGIYIDGQDTRDVADRIAKRLREAFAVPDVKKEEEEEKMSEGTLCSEPGCSHYARKCTNHVLAWARDHYQPDIDLARSAADALRALVTEAIDLISANATGNETPWLAMAKATLAADGQGTYYRCARRSDNASVLAAEGKKR